MKKILIPLLLVLSLALAACGKSTTTSITADDNTNLTGLSTEMELIVGTMKLDGTENAVTAEEAADLIPLWQAYASLSQLDTTAQAELDSLINQIKDTMGEDKMNAIAAMGLTQDDMLAFMQENGMMGGGARVDAAGTPVVGQDMGGFTQSFDSSGGMPSGGPPSGGMPPGGGAMPSTGEVVIVGGGGDMGITGQGMDPSALATAEASGVQVNQMKAVPPAMVQELIQYLQSIK